MNALQKIVKAAKQLQKARPQMKWSDAIKKASAQYRAAGKKPTRKVGQSHTDTKSHNVKIHVVSGTRKKKARAGSVLLLERGEKPGKKPERTYRVNRTKKGTYKKFTRLAGSDNDTLKILRSLTGRKVKAYNTYMHVWDDNKGSYKIVKIPLSKNVWTITDVVWNGGKGMWFIYGERSGTDKLPGQLFTLSFAPAEYSKLQDFIQGKIIRNTYDRKPYAKLLK